MSTAKQQILELQLQSLPEHDESSPTLADQSAASRATSTAAIAAAAPRDTLRLVYTVFLLHGVGILLPWNVFINANEYFVNYKLNTNISREADYRSNFMNYIGLGSQLPNLLMLACNVFYQPLVRHRGGGGGGDGGSSNAGRRMMLVILVEIGVCAMTVVLALVDTTQCPKLFFDITLISVVITNCCTGVYQSSAFGMAGLLPMNYSSAVVLGNNICGTVIAIVNLVSRLASSQDLQLTAVAYFSFSILLLILCFGSLVLLPRLKFYRHYQRAATSEEGHEKSAQERQEDEDERLIRSAVLLQQEDEAVEGETEATEQTGGSSCCCAENVDTLRACFGLCCVRKEPAATCHRYWIRYINALKECWVHCLSVWTVFFCTLACFPAVQSAIRPAQLTWLEAWFTDIFVFLFFNLFAMLGSLTSNFVQIPSPRWLALAAWSRTLIFIPFFVLCNCFPGNRAPMFPVAVANDYVFIGAMVAFGFTNGYLSALGMMYAPRDVQRSEYAGLAGMVSSFFLVLGIFCGVSFGGVLYNVIQA